MKKDKVNLYNEQFYDNQSKESFDSAIEVFSVLFNLLQPKSITSAVDFGCGVAPWLAASQQLGVEKVYGIDGEYVPKDRLLISESDFYPSDLSKPNEIELPIATCDLAISLEVAEHLPTNVAKLFVEKLCNTADIILFSAAIPYQGGHGHINENWPEFWANLFSDFGFEPFDIIRPAIWHNDKVCWWYKQNTLLFVKKGKDNIFRSSYSASSLEQLSIVHPEQYITSVHRENTTIHHSLANDVNYYKTILKEDTSAKQNNYGIEFSYIEKEDVQFQSVDELKNHSSPVIRDSISSIELKEEFTSLKISNKQNTPDFLVIGAQKSATTWLYQLLSKQEGYWLPPIKELNYFNSQVFTSNSTFSGGWRRATAIERLNYALSNNPNIPDSWLNLLVHLTKSNIDINWYLDIFRWAGQNKVTGDVTPEYSLLPKNVIQEIYNVMPNLKIVLLLREPTKRALSHLKMIKLNEPLISTELLTEVAQMTSVFERSNYPKIIRNWQSVFPKENIHIICYEKLKVRPHDVIFELGKFLGKEISLNSFEDNVIHKSTAKLDNEVELEKVLSNNFENIKNETIELIPEFETFWK